MTADKTLEIYKRVSADQLKKLEKLLSGIDKDMLTLLFAYVGMNIVEHRKSELGDSWEYEDLCNACGEAVISYASYFLDNYTEEGLNLTYGNENQ